MNPGNFEYIERLILSDFGVQVSIRQKAKSLNKFGRSTQIDSSGFGTVAQFQGSTLNETYATGNTVDSIISSDPADAGPVVVEGHRLVGQDLQFVSQTATLQGQEPSPLPTPLMRATRAYRPDGTFAAPTTPILGSVAVYDSSAAGGVALGVPNNAPATKLMIIPESGSINNSLKCATAISYSDVWIITGVSAGIERNSGASTAAEINVESKSLSGVWRFRMPASLTLRREANPWVRTEFNPPILLGPNSDVRMVARSNQAATVVHGTIYGYLAAVVG